MIFMIIGTSFEQPNILLPFYSLLTYTFSIEKYATETPPSARNFNVSQNFVSILCLYIAALAECPLCSLRSICLYADISSLRYRCISEATL